jgi:hypothetical protein
MAWPCLGCIDIQVEGLMYLNFLKLLVTTLEGPRYLFGGFQASLG